MRHTPQYYNGHKFVPWLFITAQQQHEIVIVNIFSLSVDIQYNNTQ